MKALKFAVIILTALALNSCNDKDESTPAVTKLCRCRATEDTYTIPSISNPYYHHSLWLSFQDDSGNDLMKGIGFDTWSSEVAGLVTGGEDDYGGPVKSELFTLEYVFEDGIPNVWDSWVDHMGVLHEYYPTMTLQKDRAYEEWMQDLIAGSFDYNYLRFDTQSRKYVGVPEALLYGSSISICDFAEKIIFRLTCPYIFGNDKAHDIITWWSPLGENLAVCYSVEYGGKEFPIEGNVSYQFATIILNK